MSDLQLQIAEGMYRVNDALVAEKTAPCERCDGTGRTGLPAQQTGGGSPFFTGGVCPDCDGTGMATP